MPMFCNRRWYLAIVQSLRNVNHAAMMLTEWVESVIFILCIFQNTGMKWTGDIGELLLCRSEGAGDSRGWCREGESVGVELEGKRIGQNKTEESRIEERNWWCKGVIKSTSSWPWLTSGNSIFHLFQTRGIFSIVKNDDLKLMKILIES